MGIDLKKLFHEVIETYGHHMGYEIPEIVWSDEVMLSRFGEYQFWTNKIIISKVLDSSKISAEAIKSVIYHEYTHQLYEYHDMQFDAKMQLFPGYKKYQDELDAYYNNITDLPAGMKNPLPLETEKETVFCLLPLNKDGDESYLNQFIYCNHNLMVTSWKNIPQSFCESAAAQVVWLICFNKKMYAVGWSKNVKFFAKKKKLFSRNNWISEGVPFNCTVLQKDCKLIAAANAFPVLGRNECPQSLLKNGICSSGELDQKIVEEIVAVINGYDYDYIDIGILDSALDCTPGIISNDADELLKIHSSDYSYRDFIIGNKLVMLEKSYRTFLRRGLAYANMLVFDRAIADLTAALSYRINCKEMSKTDVKFILEALQNATEEMEAIMETA